VKVVILGLTGAVVRVLAEDDDFHVLQGGELQGAQGLGRVDDGTCVEALLQILAQLLAHAAGHELID
jgi:hypothetical protein